MTFLELIKKFPYEESCVNYYLKIRYPQGVHCNHCGSPKTYQRKGNLKLFDCKDCFNTFSPFKDTIFEKSSTDLRKWFYAIHLFLNGKKGISALQLQRKIGVTYKTAWRMLHQIVQLWVMHHKRVLRYNHTNTIESFWATLKRGVYGIYHHVSVKHMQAYVDEFCFRYNNRGLNMFDMVLMQAKL